eukprot:1760342-Lingulodinium_polyedra.AAC.1
MVTSIFRRRANDSKQIRPPKPGYSTRCDPGKSAMSASTCSSTRKKRCRFSAACSSHRPPIGSSN